MRTLQLIKLQMQGILKYGGVTDYFVLLYTFMNKNTAGQFDFGFWQQFRTENQYPAETSHALIPIHKRPHISSRVKLPVLHTITIISCYFNHF